MPEQKGPAAPPTEFKRKENFASVYANNVRYESSVWDLKMILGELDQKDPGNLIVEQHTAVTIPWIQIKLMIYYLGINLKFHETAQGKIKIPVSVLPPELGPIPPNLENDPGTRANYEFARELREKLIASSI